MLNFQKIYWIKQWPNNGFGKLLFGIPLLKFYIILDSSGKIIIRDKIEDLATTIAEKERWMQDCIEHGGPRKEYDQTAEIEQLKKYLTAC